jgi:hypothetical protein
LDYSRDLVRFAFGRHLCVAEHLAGRFLDAALDLFDRTLNAIFADDVILRELIKKIEVLRPANHPYDECDQKYCSKNAAADVHKKLPQPS